MSLIHAPSRVNSWTTLECWSATHTNAPPGENASACGKRNTPCPTGGSAPRIEGCSAPDAGATAPSAMSSATAGATRDRGTLSRLCLPRGHEQRLQRAAEAPALVVQDRLGE